MQTLYHYSLGIIVALGVLTLIASILGQGGYGRHLQSSKATVADGPAWLLFECPQFCAFALAYWLTVGEHFTPGLVLFGLWQSHYIYRSIIYPLRRRGQGQRFPIMNMVMGFVFNALNGFANGYAVAHAPHLQSLTWLLSPWFLGGLLLAVFGWIINFQADSILIGLRSKDGTGGYKIPYGGFFRYVSSANYFGEIVLWLGWAFMCSTWAGWVFVFFTLSNLVPRAVHNHRWYLQKFADYPKDRKMVIPYLL